ncbi:MAG TPA: SDR family oxidoreductase [Thermoanaerobaculia bacterium]|nr:SDR family oxidoreductase [Thermoanaerobaculia bacterium]
MTAPDYRDGASRLLAGRTLLVTGGAHRVGEAISRHLGSLGARIVVHAHRHLAAAEDLVASLPAGGLALAADLRSPDGAARVYEQLGLLAPEVDGLVHAAASFRRGSLAEVEAGEWDEVHALNLRSFALLAERRLAARGSRGGDLVAIGDAAGIELWPSYIAHSVAKAGLLALVRALAKGMAPAFRVNAVVPGPVLPPEGTTAEQAASFAGRTLLQRLGRPEDVAEAVAYLLGARFVTGAVLPVTGGSELWRGQRRI